MSWMASRARRRGCLKSIKVRIVSGFKLALRSEIVSLPAEKIRSTATAEPGIEIMSRAKRDRLGNYVIGRTSFVLSSHIQYTQSRSSLITSIHPPATFTIAANAKLLLRLSRRDISFEKVESPLPRRQGPGA